MSNYPPGVSESDIDRHFGPDIVLEQAVDALDKAEQEYLSCLAKVRGTMRALLTVRQIPSAAACKTYLDNMEALDPLWKAYKAALAHYEEASQ